MFKLISATALSLLLAVGSADKALAEWQPSGPIKILIAFGAGGGSDTQARLIAEELENRKGWKILPENLPGKGGALMANQLKGEPADGLSIGLLTSDTLSYNMLAAQDAGYSQDDFTALTTTAGFQMGVVAMTSSGWATWSDFAENAKGTDTFRFGSFSPRVADVAYALGQIHDINFNIVSVKGGKGAMNALRAGDVDLALIGGPQNSAVEAGEMVNILSALNEPLKISPDAPTMADVNMPFDAGGHFVFVAPAGLPEEARDIIIAAIVEIIEDPSTKANAFIETAFGGPAIIQGDDLSTALAEQLARDKALLEAVSQ